MRIVILMALVLLTGCVHNSNLHRPVVDMGASTGNYELDLAECQALSKQRASRAQKAAAGAAIGAILGAALGHAAGVDSRHLGSVAATGAVSGVAAGGAVDEQATIVTRCIIGRGWNVVGDA